MVADRRVTNPSLKSRADVEAWFLALLEAGCNFHPEETFENMVDRDGEPSFSPADARRMDCAMARAYDLTGDACEVAVAVLAEFDHRESA